MQPREFWNVVQFLKYVPGWNHVENLNGHRCLGEMWEKFQSLGIGVLERSVCVWLCVWYMHVCWGCMPVVCVWCSMYVCSMAYVVYVCGTSVVCGTHVCGAWYTWHASVRNIQTCREFLWVYWSQNWWQLLGSKISNTLENEFFILLCVLEIKEDYMKVEESKARIGLHTVKICALWGCLHLAGVLLPAFPRRVNLAAQEEQTGLAWKPLTKEVIGLGCDYPPRPAQLGLYDQITLWCNFPQNPFFKHSGVCVCVW